MSTAKITLFLGKLAKKANNREKSTSQQGWRGFEEGGEWVGAHKKTSRAITAREAKNHSYKLFGEELHDQRNSTNSN